MKWYITKTNNGQQFFIINKEYALSIFKSNKQYKCVHPIAVERLKENDKFKRSKEINEIEMMVLDLYKMIEAFVPRIKKLPLYSDCKNNYNNEIKEFKEYFKELESKNSACGENKEKK